MIKSQFCSRTHFFQSFMLNQVELVCSTLHQNWTMFWLTLPTVAWGPAIVQLSVKFQNLIFQKIIPHYHSRILNSRITCPTAGQQPYLFSIVIQVWLENIVKVCSKDVIKDSRIFVINYKMFTAALENYFFYSFAIFQIFSITTLFLACSKLILQVTFIYPKSFNSYLYYFQHNFNTNNILLLVGPCLSLGINHILIICSSNS